MKRTLLPLLLVCSLLAIGAFAQVSGTSASVARDDDAGPRGSAAVDEVDPALVDYQARVEGHLGVPVAEAAAPECPEGSVMWHRDSLTDVCTPLCLTDSDCIEGIERCAALQIAGVVEDESDSEDGDSRGRRDFVDDEPGALERVEAGAAMAVCDPFFDFDGATDAELVTVAD
jgi:hypothetical protein